MIPFAPPYISEEAIQAVVDVLKSGWITTGPVTKEFENRITEFCGHKKTLCLNSATAGLELMLRWFGVGAGDEVIIPAYTYCATANVVMHCGATPVMVDSDPDDFNISSSQLKSAISENTKVIIPVDLFGFPCDFEKLNSLVNLPEIKKLFNPKTDLQKELGRILVLSDAAHSLGASYKNSKTGKLTDVTVFSFHAVKNLTTAEGGAIALNLPSPFDNGKIYQDLNILSLHGQSKDAFAKVARKGWRYDVLNAGYKMNMTDIQAALGMVQLEEYPQILEKRKNIFEKYDSLLGQYPWAELPVHTTMDRTSCHHVYNLKIKNIQEAERDRIIESILEEGVAVNVHFQPLPLLSFYKNLGYEIKKFPNAYQHYSREISLPVFHKITEAQIHEVVAAVAKAVKKILPDA